MGGVDIYECDKELEHLGQFKVIIPQTFDDIRGEYAACSHAAIIHRLLYPHQLCWAKIVKDYNFKVQANGPHNYSASARSPQRHKDKRVCVCGV